MFTVVPPVVLGMVAFQEPGGKEPIRVTGSIEQFFVSGKFFQNRVTRERLTRTQVQASHGNFSLVGTYWQYPACGFDDLDETNLRFNSNNFSAKVGKFLPPVGQTNWDDQWYSGFVFLPMVETASYGTGKILFRTVAGVRADTNANGANFQFSAFNSNQDARSINLSKLDRYSIRAQKMFQNTILGVTRLASPESASTRADAWVADLRWSVPQWIVRGEYMDYRQAGADVSGFFADVYHRPKGWSDVTLLSRVERVRSSGGTTSAWTIGTKVRLPQEFFFNVNYSAGPNQNSQMLGGGWSLGLFKIVNF
jgi:hypothetical protein